MSGMIRLSEIIPDAAGKNLSVYIALNKAWTDCAGDAIAFMTTVSKFDNGVLNIAVHDQNWLSELNFMKGELAESIKKINPDIKSLQFYFRMRKTKQPDVNDRHKPMSDKEKTYADRIIDSITDPDLRESFRRAIYSYFTIYSLDDYLGY